MDRVEDIAPHTELPQNSTMASLSAFSLSTPTSPSSLSNCPLSLQFPRVQFHPQFKNSAISRISSALKFQRNPRRAVVRAVAEEEGTLIPEEEAAPPAADAAAEQTVSVAVSPSDVLTMFFQVGFFFSFGFCFCKL